MPLSIFAMIDSVMMRRASGALWQVPARSFEPPGRGASPCAGWRVPVKGPDRERIQLEGPAAKPGTPPGPCGLEPEFPRAACALYTLADLFHPLCGQPGLVNRAC
jgi:hypothetical protein